MYFFRCLVFGTDGLWNVVSPQGAVDNVRHSDLLNEHNASIDGESKEWINPSKNLVDKALERWSSKKMRADNTSVVIIMFDPPGPPKRESMKSSSSKSHVLGYAASESDHQPSQHLEIEPVQNLAMYDHSTHELMDLDGVPLPTNGATVLTRYENITESDVQKHNQQQAYASESDQERMDGNEESYMSSFAESYNSLLNSSLNEDHSYVYNNEASDDSDFDDSNSYDNPNTTHQYVEPIYSLHKLQTRSEQQYDSFASTSASMPSTSQAAMYESYQHNLDDHNYLGDPSQYPSTSRGYTGRDEVNGHDESETTLLPLISSEYHIQPNASVDPNDIKIIENYYSPKESPQIADKLVKATSFPPKECVATTSKMLLNQMETDAMDDSLESSIDDSIQINEISSSDNNDSNTCAPHMRVSPRLKKATASVKKSNIAVQQSLVERKVTRSSLATPVRITRSTGTEKRAQLSVARNLKSKMTLIIQNPSAQSGEPNGRNHKENISILRKVPIKAFVDSAIVTPSRTRNSETPQQDNKLLKQRTLRSQNTLPKVSVSKTVQRSTANQNAEVNRLMQQLNRVVVQTRVYPVLTRANASHNTKSNANNNNNNASSNPTKNLNCKKPTKRLINADSVQIIKSNCNNRLQKSSESLTPAARTSTLRFKVVVAKKSVMEQLGNDVRPSITTRRMRLQQ